MQELIITRDYRYLGSNGQQIKDGPREFFKVRRLLTGSITPVYDRSGKLVDEIEIRDGAYVDLPKGSLYETFEEAQTALRQMS